MLDLLNTVTDYLVYDMDIISNVAYNTTRHPVFPQTITVQTVFGRRVVYRMESRNDLF